MSLPPPRVPGMEEELEAALPSSILELSPRPLVAFHGLAEMHVSVSAKLSLLRTANLESLPPPSQKPRRQTFDGIQTQEPLLHNHSLSPSSSGISLPLLSSPPHPSPPLPFPSLLPSISTYLCSTCKIQSSLPIHPPPTARPDSISRITLPGFDWATHFFLRCASWWDPQGWLALKARPPQASRHCHLRAVGTERRRSPSPPFLPGHLSMAASILTGVFSCRNGARGSIRSHTGGSHGNCAVGGRGAQSQVRGMEHAPLSERSMWPQ